ncbi:unnamed protein product [Prorocentrum cordatum]|uniref:Uncharacterized protein n=1 Tax=Prorocentrum cordatum TaxID=2364126 RepID=A0ABN9XGW6_9DINO|nr:unnamed protein product [Polarella glacialis]
MASGDNYNSSVDAKILVLKGETLKDLTRHKRAVQAAELGCESKEQRTALGPKLHRNLLGADNSISVSIEQTDPRKYAVEDGANVLLKFQETERFAKSRFRELPKAFDTFFDLTHFDRKRRNLEEADPDTRISSNECGYHTQKRSGLDKDERNQVIASVDEMLNSVKISCGRMDHNAPECPANGHSGKPAKCKGRDKARGPNANYIHMQPEKDYDIRMVNLCSDPISPDRPELVAMVSSDVVQAPPVNSGASIGVAERGWLDRVEAELAKHGLKPVKEYFEIPGEVVGLTSRKDLAEWKTNLYTRDCGHWANFQVLGSHGSQPLFERFRAGEMQREPGAFLVAETLQEYDPGFQVEERADSWVAEASKNGSKGRFQKGTLKRIDKLMKEYSVIFDAQLRDRRAQGMGDRVGDLIEDFRPLVDFSAKVLRTQAAGGRAGIGENPLTSRAWNEEPMMDLLRWHGGRPPLYEMAFLHQCMFGLTDDYGAPIRQATRMLVPNVSCFPRWLDGKCDQRREHADTVFQAEKDLIDVRALRQGEAIPAPRGAVRRIYAMCTDRGALADFSDAYADDPNFMAVALAARYPTDTVVAIYAAEPKAQTSFPAATPFFGSRPEAFKPDDREAGAVHRDLHRKGESFGDKPSDITTPQWGALRKLHLDLGHPSAFALKRRLKSDGVSQKALDTVGKWDCVARKELGGPNTARSANLKLSTEFNDNVFLGEAKVFLYGAAKGHIAQRFAEVGEKHNTLTRLVPAEAPQLKGRVGRAIDFFKDHFQRLIRDVQLTKSDGPSAWTSVIASTRNNRIRRNGFTPHQHVLGRSPNVPASLIEATKGDRWQLAAQSAALFEGGPRRAEQICAAANRAFFELDSDDAVRRATVGRVRPPRGPFVQGQLAFCWGEVKHVKSSYRGVPVLAAPAQARHASRGEAEIAENEDLARQPSQWRGGPTLQKGFVDERGPGPEGRGGQRDRRRRNDDGDSDNEDAVGDAPATKTPRAECYPKCYHYLEMETTRRTLEMKIHPEMETTCKMLRRTTHLYLMQLGRGLPRTWARPLCQAIRSNSLSNMDSQNLRHSLFLEGPCTIDHYLATSKQIAKAPACVAKLLSRVRNRSRGAFVARRTGAAKEQVTPKKGRELRSIPPAWRTAFEASDLEEWRKWILHDAVARPCEEEIAGVEKTDILPMRRVRADKNEPARGSLSCEQRPLRAKSRGIVPGYKDKQLLAGEFQTNAPTRTDTATAVTTQEAASQPGWSLEQGDVDSAFLNGRCRQLQARVLWCSQGRHACSAGAWVAIRPRRGSPEGEEGHLRVERCTPVVALSLPGALIQAAPGYLRIFHDEREKLIGLIGTHVDDDLVAGSPEFFANQVAELRKAHCRGKWQTAMTGLHNCGRFLKQNDDGAIKRSQKECTESTEKIPISAERPKDARATAEEGAMLHSGNGQIQWPARSTRMDAAFRLAQDLLDFNELVSDARTGRVGITDQKLDMDNVIAAAVGGSSHGNVGKTTASQAGLVTWLADNTDGQFLRGLPANLTPMLRRSHRLKRVARSTLAAATMAALEAVKSGDMLRQHLVELHHGLGYWAHMDDVKAIRMVEVTDFNSLYDLLQKRGAAPSEKRLLIDIESLRNEIEVNSVVSKWVNTKQMLADCLTKQDVRAGDHARHAPRTGRLTGGPMAEQVISEQRIELKCRRGDYDRSTGATYPRRHRPADQPFAREGYAHFEDCGADLRYNARSSTGDDIYYEELEDMVDWSGLDQVAKRRRIPTHARMLLTTYAPTKEALECHEKDFTEKHNLKETDTTDDIEHHEDANVISDESLHTDDTADLDDVKEIYMMDAAGAETEEIGGGAAGAGATLVARAVRRVVVDQCECEPRRASYTQVAHDLGDALEEDILEAYQQGVAGCNERRSAAGLVTSQNIPRQGKNSEKGTGKLRAPCRVDPDECVIQQEKELRAEVNAIRLEKQKQELLGRARAPTAGRSSTG